MNNRVGGGSGGTGISERPSLEFAYYEEIPSGDKLLNQFWVTCNYYLKAEKEGEHLLTTYTLVVKNRFPKYRDLVLICQKKSPRQVFWLVGSFPLPSDSETQAPSILYLLPYCSSSLP